MAVRLSLSIAYLVGQCMGQEHGSEPLKQIQKWILIFLYVIDIKALSSRPEVEPNGLLEVALSSPVACLRQLSLVACHAEPSGLLVVALYHLIV